MKKLTTTYYFAVRALYGDTSQPFISFHEGNPSEERLRKSILCPPPDSPIKDKFWNKRNPLIRIGRFSIVEQA